MLGQAHTPRRRWLGVALAALMVVLVVPAAGGADPSTRADALRAQNATLATRSHSALLGLYSLDTRLASARARLDGLRAQAAELRRERASLAVQLAVARSGIRISQRRLAARLRLLYEQGDVSVLEIMLGSKTLDDAITTLDNLNRVASLDADVLAQVRDARRHLNGASAALSERRARLAATTRGAEATAASLEQAKAERTAFVADLSQQRRLNSAQISQLQTEAQAAQVRTAALTRAAPDATVAAPAAVAVDAPAAPVSAAVAPPQGGRTITVSATGYALPGTTATGLPVGWGVVAVDPSVIPLGSHMTIPGYGEAVAADTGGAIVGATIDLWFPSVAQAQAWGRRTVTITVH